MKISQSIFPCVQFAVVHRAQAITSSSNLTHSIYAVGPTTYNNMSKMPSPTKIELVTQPPKESENSVREDVLRKLLELVDRNSASESAQKSTDAISGLNKDKTKGKDYSKEVLNYSPSSATVDSDGFEVPEGKIPLDGHFSTDEVKELVELSKEEGLLNEDVSVHILQENEVVGDRVELAEGGEDKEESEREKDD